MRRWTDGLHLGDHVLHPYRDEIERERAVLDIFDWLPKGAMMFYLPPSRDAGGILDGTGPDGESLRGALRDGRLWTKGAEDVYRPEGSFSVERTLRDLVLGIEAAKSQGFSSVVAVGDASWVAKDPASFPNLIRYESSINLMELPLGVTFMCQYHHRALPVDQMAQLESVHDHLLVGRELERRYWILPRRGIGSRMARSL